MPVVPIVAIEIPAEVAPDLASRALRTCNLALGSGRCAIFDASTPTTNVDWLAHVGVDPTRPNLLQIELRDSLPQHRMTTYVRSLTFEESDAVTHRWSTAGVVVAALVISAESGRSAASTPSATPSVEPSDGNAVTPTPQTKASANDRRGPARAGTNEPAVSHSPERAFRLDLGAVAGPGIEGHVARYGGALRPSVELLPSLVLWGQVGASRGADSITVSWWSGAVGVGLVTSVVPGRFAIEARIAAVGNRLVFKVVDAAGDSDSATRWRFGAGAGLDAALALADSFGLFVGVDGVLANPRVKIRQAGNEVGQSPTIETLVVAGLRWRIPLER
jgi:hypothetical protein